MGVENLKCELKQWKSLCDMIQESKPRTLTVQIAVDCQRFYSYTGKLCSGKRKLHKELLEPQDFKVNDMEVQINRVITRNFSRVFDAFMCSFRNVTSQIPTNPIFLELSSYFLEKKNLTDPGESLL